MVTKPRTKTSELSVNSAFTDKLKKPIKNLHQESSVSIPPIKNSFSDTKSPVNSNSDHFKKPWMFDTPALPKKEIISHSPNQEDQSSTVVNSVAGFTDQYIFRNFFDWDLLDGFVLPDHQHQAIVATDHLHVNCQRVVLGFGVNELSEFCLL
ncbi:hypothetical protein MJO28_011795 [Puccinia striiformis f. sp. tritici]|uniref:Uncharacterized protein n=1 Tax=Puccinia striiformis f. sp. tritici TaxID=168172 RepID=A0ACC0E3M3_9BASI|nr:hypothetical protein Pst134EA_021371 [Puccinia striiformis f. sp. tritici]KAH9448254.1 hypothetical protein Pst134EB_022242 [Puccinia striiformis f. sp. tritici]KAH9457497.1 hypothetical protein Pst134EA_021371 [Puccinia striiformis f. sp. tritici]KAI7944267.1 hypothetical protein MJO28_011795 [Puccinia striiformis f. sp. tritici]KAI7947026.1 hypothetical protein MJO29_011553 [Puccinia striiformis f. sp. tritici]